MDSAGGTSRPEVHTPPGPATPPQAETGAGRACGRDLSTGVHRQDRLSHKVVPSQATNDAESPAPVDDRITPARRGQRPEQKNPARRARVSETAYARRSVIPRRSTDPTPKRPQRPPSEAQICQRRDGTVSCQRYPHQFTGVHRLLSPAVDKASTRTPQMWIKPGEIDVDRHEGLRSCPPPVEECGFPVEGSGDDGSVASPRCPQLGGQTPWISGG
jgi:hypothetical protein